MVYRFIDKYKEVFGVRWLLRKLSLWPNSYYNYLKNRKSKYHKKRQKIYEEIKSIYYNNARILGHRVIRIFLTRKGIILSKNTVHKYMNKTLNLHAVVMRKRPKYGKEIKKEGIS